MKISPGKVAKRTWVHKGKKRTAWGYSFKVDGVPRRRQGFLLQTEAQEALEQARDAILRPAPTPALIAPPSMALAEAFACYFQAKARKKSLATASAGRRRAPGAKHWSSSAASRSIAAAIRAEGVTRSGRAGARGRAGPGSPRRRGRIRPALRCGSPAPRAC